MRAAYADLGTIVPIVGALALVNGVDPVGTFLVFGVLFVATAATYRVPVAVQPIKAAAAIAIATQAPAQVVVAAGIVLGAVLVLLAVLRAGPLLVRLFPEPVVRGNQLGVGLLLAAAAVRLAHDGGGGVSVAVSGVVLVCALAAGEHRFPVALAMVGAGAAWSLVHQGAGALVPAPGLPGLDVPGVGDLALATTLLVIPQLPLTLGNAVVGTSALAHEYLGPAAHRVTPGRLMLTSGAGNLAAGLLGGAPLCHGSSGLTAYHRLGARGADATLVAVVTFVLAALVYGDRALELLALIPLPVMAGLLAHTGVRHALLVRDQRACNLVVALAMGGVAAGTRNLAFAMAVGIPLWGLGAGWERWRRVRRPVAPNSRLELLRHQSSP